jgi:hypothetical protein
MTVRQHRMSTVPHVGAYLDPDGRTFTINEDWEQGPLALNDSSLGLAYQAWHLTFAAGDFTMTPEDTGPPVVVLSGIDSVQCSCAFDQNAHVTIAWVDSSDQGH